MPMKLQFSTLIRQPTTSPHQAIDEHQIVFDSLSSYDSKYR